MKKLFILYAILIFCMLMTSCMKLPRTTFPPDDERIKVSYSEELNEYDSTVDWYKWINIKHHFGDSKDYYDFAVVLIEGDMFVEYEYIKKINYCSNLTFLDIDGYQFALNDSNISVFTDGIVKRYNLKQFYEEFDGLDIKDIRDIHKQHKELYPDNYTVLNRINVPALSKEEDYKLRNAYSMWYNEKYAIETVADSFYTWAYFGTYNDAVVVSFCDKDPGSNETEQSYILGDETILYNFETIRVFYNNEFYDIDDAYANKILTLEDVEKIAGYHRVKFPYLYE